MDPTEHSNESTTPQRELSQAADAFLARVYRATAAALNGDISEVVAGLKAFTAAAVEVIDHDKYPGIDKFNEFFDKLDERQSRSVVARAEILAEFVKDQAQVPALPIETVLELLQRAADEDRYENSSLVDTAIEKVGPIALNLVQSKTGGMPEPIHAHYGHGDQVHNVGVPVGRVHIPPVPWQDRLAFQLANYIVDGDLTANVIPDEVWAKAEEAAEQIKKVRDAFGVARDGT